MNRSIRILAAALLAGAALGAGAQSMKPGLWEITHKMSSGSGEMEKAMADMQKQMAEMTPEQRKMMQDMMAKQGGGMSPGMGAGGASTMKVCISKEMAERNEVGASQQGDCKQTNSARSGNTMKFAFSCSNPPSSGEGQVSFVSPEAYTMKMTSNTMMRGKAEKMTMDASGKFLSSDCGNIKAMAPPKK